MTSHFSQYEPERRQSPRVLVKGEVECHLDSRTRVRLLDISLSGALVATELSLPANASGALRAELGTGSFRTTLQVQHTTELHRGVPIRGLGAKFTAMDDRSRRSLEAFLQKASQ